MVGAAAAGAVVFVVTAALISRPYQRVADEFPAATRAPATVAAYSGPPQEFLVAPDENLVWGDATASLRDGLSNVPEKTLFPGLLTIVLAIVGLGWRGWPRALRYGLGAAAIAISVLALGFREEGGLLWPYRVLYDVLPGWDAIPDARKAGHLLVARPGAARGGEARSERRPGQGPPAGLGSPRSAIPLLALAIIVEGRGLPFDPTGSATQPHAPATPPSTAAVPAPQLHLPAERPGDNRRYLLWSTDGFPAI